MQTLPIRVASAIILIGILWASYFFMETKGVLALGTIIVFLGVLEFDKLTFALLKAPIIFRYWFIICCAILTLNMTYGRGFVVAVLGGVIVLFFSVALWLTRNKVENNDLLRLMTTSGLGFIYCALFPGLVLRVLTISGGGIYWFGLLCLVAPIGDVFAYFGGLQFGKNKMMPQLSPAKTLEGSYFGYFGSLLVGLSFGLLFLKDTPLWYVLIVTLVTAFVAQSGDLFESLIKRVAQVKDSGKIMPGHGGVLDRLDAIYFSGPIVYLAVVSRHYIFG